MQITAFLMVGAAILSFLTTVVFSDDQQVAEQSIPLRSLVQTHDGVVWTGGYTQYTLPEQQVLSLDHDVKVRADRLVINGKIYTNGHLFSVETREIEFGANGSIDGFQSPAAAGADEPNVEGEPEPQPTECKHYPTPGRTGTEGKTAVDGSPGTSTVKPIRVFTFKSTGTGHSIHGIGQQGGTGGTGGRGQKGGQGMSGRDAIIIKNALGIHCFACRRADNSTGGGDAGPGGEPGKGGQGGNGGKGGAPIPLSFLLGFSPTGKDIAGSFISKGGAGGKAGLAGGYGEGGDPGRPGAGAAKKRWLFKKCEFPSGRASWKYQVSDVQKNVLAEQRVGKNGADNKETLTPTVLDFNRITTNRDGVEQAWLRYFWIAKIHQHFVDSIRLLPEVASANSNLYLNTLDQRIKILNELRSNSLSYNFTRDSILSLSQKWTGQFQDIITAEILSSNDPIEINGLTAAKNLADDLTKELKDLLDKGSEFQKDLAKLFEINLDSLLIQNIKQARNACNAYVKLVDIAAKGLEQSVDFMVVPACNHFFSSNELTKNLNPLYVNPYQNIVLQKSITENMKDLEVQLVKTDINYSPRQGEEFGFYNLKSTGKKSLLNYVLALFMPTAFAEEHDKIIFLNQLIPLNIKVIRNSFKESKNTNLTAKGLVQSFAFPQSEQVTSETLGYYMAATALQSVHLRRR